MVRSEGLFSIKMLECGLTGYCTYKVLRTSLSGAGCLVSIDTSEYWILYLMLLMQETSTPFFRTIRFSAIQFISNSNVFTCSNQGILYVEERKIWDPLVMQVYRDRRYVSRKIQQSNCILSSTIHKGLSIFSMLFVTTIQ